MATSPIPGLRPPERFERPQACKLKLFRRKNNLKMFSGLVAVRDRARIHEAGGPAHRATARPVPVARNQPQASRHVNNAC